MIVVQLKGGHSNQMFQYAAARSLAHRNKTDLQIDLIWYADTSKYDSPRQYELGSYTIQEHLYRPNIVTTITSRLHRTQHYTEPSYTYDSAFENLGANTYIEGDFQSEKYFLSIRPLLLQDFSYKNEPSKSNKALLKKINADPQAVSLHIRRGDYANNKNVNIIHGLKDIAYYKTALKELKKKVKNPNLYVISNDPAWCKKNLQLDAPMYFVDNNDDLTGGAEDMRLMRACKHNIMANSSFSWWGAWLNENPDKIVIAPKVWFQDESISTQDLIPKSWIRL